MLPVLADDQSIALAAQLLKQGWLVAFPTETVYGLGADASNAEAVAGIFKAKGRPADHPLIVHIASVDKLTDWAKDIPEAALKLAEKFWPGPLAIILNKQPQVPLAVTGGQQTVGLRVPNHPVALALLTQFGGGVAAPSANRFCRISPTQASHVAEELGDKVDMILDGGACLVGVESTIIDLSGAQPRLLRPGHITVAQLTEVLQTDILLPQVEVQLDIRAPGMMEVHYAPSTKAIRCDSEKLAACLQQFDNNGQLYGVLTCQSSIASTSQTPVIQLANQADLYAQGLYAALRQLDGLQLDVILVEQPPQTAAWQAVNDRLHKATSSH